MNFRRLLFRFVFATLDLFGLILALILATIPDTQKADAFARQCALFENKRQYHQALPLCAEAIHFNPRSGWPYYLRGIAYHAMEDYEHAVADFGMAQRLNYAMDRHLYAD